MIRRRILKRTTRIETISRSALGPQDSGNRHLEILAVNGTEIESLFECSFYGNLEIREEPDGILKLICRTGLENKEPSDEKPSAQHQSRKQQFGKSRD
ncbi:MAG: hypothetical protein R2684_08625 [Pyrinomonadaceae bacterium]